LVPLGLALQVALLVYLAHVGSFVTAQRAVISCPTASLLTCPAACFIGASLFTCPAACSPCAAGCAAGVPGTCGQLCASAASSGGAA
jgi:hypothetical protein